MRLVSHRVENLMKVGPWPQDTVKDSYSKQVKWIIKVQALLQEIIDLANTEQALADVIYNKEKLAQIIRLFPTFMVDKLVKIEGYKEEKYLKIIDKLDEWKQVSQNRELIYGSSPCVQSQQKSLNKSDPPPPVPTGHVNFPHPKHLPSCRICLTLKSQGETVGLFQKHISDYATGCPKFASLGTNQRVVVSREAKFCINCMGKDTKFSIKRNKECPIKKRKSIYSCKKESCLVHMWLCTKHREENRPHMEKFEEQLFDKAGIKLVFVTENKSCFQPRPPPIIVPDGQIDDGCSIPVGSVEDGASPSSPPVSPLSFCSMGEKGIKQAVRKMVRLNKKKSVLPLAHLYSCSNQ